MTVPFVEKQVCWDVKCPACDEEAEELMAVAKKSDEEKKDDKKKWGCLPEECGMNKTVCITIPVVKKQVCWNVTCPACDKKAEELLHVFAVEKKESKKEKWFCTPCADAVLGALGTHGHAHLGTPPGSPSGCS